MSLRKIKFGDKEIYKTNFYSSKQAISLDSVDLNKIVVSKKWNINDTTYKYVCGYLNNDTIQPLCVILPQMDGYIKYFDNGGKNMSFVTDDDKIYKKYNEIWKVVKKHLTFNNNNNNNSIPIEKNHYICIPAIDIDSVLKIDKRTYPQAYLEQCKYKLKKRKIVKYIDDEIIDEDSDSDIDDAVDSHLNFSVLDSYVKI